MAEIMTLMRGAVRKGLYAARSIRKPSRTVSSSTSGRAAAKGSAALR